VFKEYQAKLFSLPCYKLLISETVGYLVDQKCEEDSETLVLAMCSAFVPVCLKHRFLHWKDLRSLSLVNKSICNSMRRHKHLLPAIVVVPKAESNKERKQERVNELLNLLEIEDRLRNRDDINEEVRNINRPMLREILGGDREIRDVVDGWFDL